MNNELVAEKITSLLRSIELNQNEEKSTKNILQILENEQNKWTVDEETTDWIAKAGSIMEEPLKSMLEHTLHKEEVSINTGSCDIFYSFDHYKLLKQDVNVNVVLEVNGNQTKPLIFVWDASNMYELMDVEYPKPIEETVHQRIRKQISESVLKEATECFSKYILPSIQTYINQLHEGVTVRPIGIVSGSKDKLKKYLPKGEFLSHYIGFEYKSEEGWKEGVNNYLVFPHKTIQAIR